MGNHLQASLHPSFSTPASATFRDNNKSNNKDRPREIKNRLTFCRDPASSPKPASNGGGVGQGRFDYPARLLAGVIIRFGGFHAYFCGVHTGFRVGYGVTSVSRSMRLVAFP